MPAGKFVARCILAAALVALAANTYANYKDSYARGLAAFNSGKNAEAKSYFQSAFDEHPEPALRTQVYGKRFEPYVPQHFLGLIAAAEHDCTSLQQAQAATATEQVVAQLPDMPKLPDAVSGCASVAKNDVATSKPKAVDTASAAVGVKPPDSVASKSSAASDTASTVKKSAAPEALLRAFDDYLVGRYEAAARIDPNSLTDSRARFHAYLVRAAAEYTLSRLSPDDAAVMARARADAVAARALDRQTAPDETMFSPAFRKFYVGVR